MGLLLSIKWNICQRFIKKKKKIPGTILGNNRQLDPKHLFPRKFWYSILKPSRSKLTTKICKWSFLEISVIYKKRSLKFLGNYIPIISQELSWVIFTVLMGWCTERRISGECGLFQDEDETKRVQNAWVPDHYWSYRNVR